MKLYKKINIFKKKFYMHNLLKLNNIISKNCSQTILIYLFISLLLFITIKSQKITKLNSISEVSIKIKGNGTQQILSNRLMPIPEENNNVIYFNNTPDKILINGEIQNYRNIFVYELSNYYNTITMIWENQLTNCNLMFYGLENILEVDFSKFDSSKITSFYCMFDGCTSLLSVNLSNFNTSQITIFRMLFFQCYQLSTVDLTNFNTSLVTDMSLMFYECHSLRSVDLRSFDTSRVKNMKSMFNSCLMMKELNLNHFNTSLVSEIDYMFYQCTSLISLEIKNFDMSNIIKTEKMFNGCRSLISLDLRNFDMTLSIEMREDDFKNIYPNLTYCINDFKSNLSLLLANYKNNCSDICFTRLNHKIIEEKEVCIDECINDDIYKFENNKFCYKECPNGSYVVNNNNLCCYDNQPFILIESSECSSICKSYDFFNKNCLIYVNDISIRDNILINIQKDLINGELNEILLNNIVNRNIDYIFKEGIFVYQLTSLNNQKNNIHSDLSSIDLNECEERIKDLYHINDYQIIIFKIEVHLKGLLIPIIEYEIYSAENNSKIDLNNFQDKTILLSLPINLNESLLFKYDPNSSYYNDQCTPTRSQYGTDMILYDRRYEYVLYNFSLCEKNCKYKGYNNITKRILCECKPKANFRYLNEIISDSEKLNNSLRNENFITSLQVFRCYYVLFTKFGLLYNIGSFILILIFFIYIVTLVLFLSKGFNYLNEIMKNIVSMKINVKQNKEIKNKIMVDSNNIKHNDNSSIKNKKKLLDVSSENNNKNLSSISKSEMQNINGSNLKSNQKQDNKSFVFNDYELNNLIYEKAIKYDERQYIQYYFSLLRTKHYILFSFIPFDDYNSIIIKAFLFFLSFVLYYVINALFITPSNIHNIYLSEGKKYFSLQMANIILSSIISYILDKFIKYISKSEQNISQLNDETTNFKNIHHKYLKTIKCLIIKYTLFFIFSFIFLFLSWYYIACFGAVFMNTQIILLFNTLLSFGMAFVYPLLLNLIPGIFRIIALNSKKNDKECLYNISKILQII